jgi:hypothetical protein
MTQSRIRNAVVVAVLAASGMASSVSRAPSAGAAPIAANAYDNATILADAPITPSAPTISPDGLWTLFANNGGSELHSVPTAGGRDRLLEAQVGSFTFSPDSSRVAYQDNVGIASQAVSGAPEVRLFTGVDTDRLTVTADGRFVVFRARVPGAAGQFDLWSVPIDGGPPVRLNPALTGTGTVEFYEGSPDGTRIVFRASLTGATFDAYAVAASGGVATKLNNALPSGGKVENFIYFSPDSRYVLFAGQATAVGRDDLYSVGPDGVVHVLSTNATNLSYAYRVAIDNNRAVLFVGTGVGNQKILSAKLDGSGISTLYTSNSTEFFAGEPMLSPATGRVVFTAQFAGLLKAISVKDDGTGYKNLIFDINPSAPPVLTHDGRTVIAGRVAVANATVKRPVDASSPEEVIAPFIARVRAIDDADRNAILDRGGSPWVASLSGVLSVFEVAPTSGFTNTSSFEASPDGRRLVLEQDRMVDGQFGLVAYGPSFADGEHTNFVPLSPLRILDTRPTELIGYSGTKPSAGAVVKLQIRGRAGVPDTSDVKSVVLNLTAEDATAGGFVTAWPSGKAQPLSSNLNVETAGQTRPNLVTVGVGSDGAVSLFTYAGAHLIADIAGYYTYAANAYDGRLFPLPPTRLLDTRGGPRPGAGAIVTLDIRGRGGVPATGVSAVVLTVTATDAAAAGFVTVWPSGVPRPLASNLNLERAGQTVPNQVIVPVGSDGKVNLYTDNGTHLIADVAGWFTNGEELSGNSGLFRAFASGSIRMLDTRPVHTQGWSGPKPGPGAIVPVGFSSLGDGTSAYAMNLTMVDATAPGFVTAYPSGPGRPNASNLNSDAEGGTIANHATVAAGRPDMIVSLYTDNGTHLIGDIIGVYRS